MCDSHASELCWGLEACLWNYDLNDTFIAYVIAQRRRAVPFTLNLTFHLVDVSQSILFVRLWEMLGRLSTADAASDVKVRVC